MEWSGVEGCSMEVSCHHILSNMNVMRVTTLGSRNNKITSQKHEKHGQGLNNDNMPP